MYPSQPWHAGDDRHLGLAREKPVSPVRLRRQRSDVVLQLRRRHQRRAAVAGPLRSAYLHDAVSAPRRQVLRNDARPTSAAGGRRNQTGGDPIRAARSRQARVQQGHQPTYPAEPDGARHQRSTAAAAWARRSFSPATTIMPSCCSSCSTRCTRSTAAVSAG